MINVRIHRSHTTFGSNSGVDHKLRMDAVALVTLEPRLTKDKALQGAARMRQLLGGQSLILAGTSESLSHEVSVKDVLNKIVRNTLATISAAIPTYYERGTAYHSFPKASKVECSLEPMYGGAVSEFSNFAEYLDQTQTIETATQKTDQKQGQKDLVKYCTELGKGLSVRGDSLTQECERELEREMEEEEEEEMEVANLHPYGQENWPYELAFRRPAAFFDVLFQPLSAFVDRKLPLVAGINWSKNVYCTPNFWKTVENASNCNDLSPYLRLVDPMLVLPDGRVVLVSVYELNELLRYWWNTTKPKAVLKHFSLVVHEHDLGVGGYGKGDDMVLSDEVTASIKLVRGDVSYTEGEQQCLQLMFEDIESPRATIENLLHFRDRLPFFRDSDLDRFSFWMDEARM